MSTVRIRMNALSSCALTAIGVPTSAAAAASGPPTPVDSQHKYDFDGGELDMRKDGRSEVVGFDAYPTFPHFEESHSGDDGTSWSPSLSAEQSRLIYRRGS